MLGFFIAPSARGTRNGPAYRNLPAGRKRLGIRIPCRAASSWSDCPRACRHDGGRGPTGRRTNIAISRGGSRPSGAAASPRLSRSGLFSTWRRGNFPPCKALKTHEMRKFSPSSLRAKRENGLLPRGQARLRRILSGHGISRRGRGNFPGCKALKTHETWKLSPSSRRTKRHADQIGSAASAHPTLSASQTPANGRPASNPCGARRRNAARRRLEYG
jgi:hypothetical protein